MVTVAHGYFSMDIGGVEQNMLRTLPRLIGDSDQHQLILTHPEGPLMEKLPEAVEVFSPDQGQLFGDLYRFYQEADVAHLYTINENPIHRLPAYLAGTPIIDNPRNIIAIPNENRVRKITCASTEIAEVQSAPGRVEIIPNGVEMEGEDPPTYKKFEDGRPLRLLEIGREDKERTHRAEDFMPALHQRFPDVECHVLGRDGEDGQGISYHGYVDDPTPYYRQSHFLVHFVETEPFGMTPLEGYRQGVIPVVAGEGGIRDLVEHTETGFLMERPNKGEIIQQLQVIAERYQEDPSFWIPMAKNGFELVKEQFSLSRHLDQYRSLYREQANEPTDSFPDIPADGPLNRWFHSITLDKETVDPDLVNQTNQAEPVERDIGRLMILEARENGNAEERLAILEALETEPFRNHYEAFRERARANQDLGNHEKAREYAERAIEAEPDLPECYFIVADHFLKEGSVGNALEFLAEYQQRFPGYEPVNAMIGKLQQL